MKQELLLRSMDTTGGSSVSDSAPSVKVDKVDTTSCSPTSALSEKCAALRMDVKHPGSDSQSCSLGSLIVIPPQDIEESDASEKLQAPCELKIRSCWPSGITRDHGWSTKLDERSRRSGSSSTGDVAHRQTGKSRSRSRSPHRRISPSSLSPLDSEPGRALVYVLDAMNILKHRNDEELSFILQWDQLVAAACHYQQRGKKIFIFIRRSVEQGSHTSSLARIRAEFGSDSVVLCPAGADDDKFMISFARSREGGARIVTNDLFRDHWEEVDKRWVQENTIKYAFAAGSFIPEGLHK